MRFDGEGVDDDEILIASQSIGLDQACECKACLPLIAEQAWQLDDGVVWELVGRISRHDESQVGHSIAHELGLLCGCLTQRAAEEHIDLHEARARGIDGVDERLHSALIKDGAVG